MAAIPYALSIHHFINSVGADAGFAAIIGLAILILLFFSQARETAGLRRRADEAEAQLARLHAYVDELSRSRVAAAPTVAPVAAPPAAARIAARPAAAAMPFAARAVTPEAIPAGALATIPAAPAGVGAPALSAATRLIPLADPDAISIRALKPSDNGASEANGAEAEAAVAAPVGPPPSTAAAGANGTARVAPPPPPPVGPPTETPPARVSLRPQGPPPARPSGPPRATAPAPRRRVSRVAIAVLGALVVAAAVVVVLVVTGANSNSGPSSPGAAASQTTAAQRASRHRRQRAAAAVTPAAVTVAVLNATSTNNLAHDVMGKLTAAGYKGGSTGNSSEQSLTSTIVGYTQPAYRKDALAVAKSLNLGPASVQGVSQGDRAQACSATPTSCPAQVVVTVGADLASNG